MRDKANVITTIHTTFTGRQSILSVPPSKRSYMRGRNIYKLQPVPGERQEVPVLHGGRAPKVPWISRGFEDFHGSSEVSL